MTTREALEAALVATPDDTALHSAYADYLIDENDPRGEYIRLQLAAEDRNQPADRLRQYEQAAFEIRQQYEREWLGDLWPHLQRPPTAYSVAEPMEPNVSVTWRRGWIDGFRIGTLSDGLAAAIVEHPLTKLLRTFSAEVCEQGEGDIDDGWRSFNFQQFRGSGRFRCLRSLTLGSEENGNLQNGWTGSVLDVILATGHARRLESISLYGEQFQVRSLYGVPLERLHTLTITTGIGHFPLIVLMRNTDWPNVQRLHLDRVGLHGDEDGFEQDFHWCFRTPNLQRLLYLTLRLGEFADAGVEELLSSGFINRLKGLDLCRCNITDDGAQMLAAHPHVPKLEYLNLEGNLLSPIGIDALEAVGVQVSPNQFFAGGEMAEEY